MRIFRKDERLGDLIKVKPNNDSPNEKFHGDVDLERIKPDKMQLLRVTFHKKSRTKWHKHPNGQILIVESGNGFIGWINESNNFERRKRDISEGDIIIIGPNEKHWHGASTMNNLVHLAIHLDIDWTNAEPVTENDYEK